MAKKPAKKGGGKSGKVKSGKSRLRVIEGGAARAGKAAAEGKRVGQFALISGPALKALLRSDNHHKEQIDSLTGSLRNEIKEAVEKKHLDKRAYAIVKSFSRMTPEKAASVYSNLLAYMDLSGESDRIGAVQELPLGEKENGAKADGEDDDKPPKGGVKELEESAAPSTAQH